MKNKKNRNLKNINRNNPRVKVFKPEQNASFYDILDSLKFMIGDKVLTPFNLKGFVRGFNNGFVEVELDEGFVENYKPYQLMLIDNELMEFSYKDTYSERLEKVQFNLKIKARKFANKEVILMQKKTQRFINGKYKDVDLNFDKIPMNKDLINIQKLRFLENYNLISSISEDLLNSVQSTLSNAIISADLETITKSLRNIKGISERRVRTIARDQTAKMLEGVNMARQQELGIEYYIWETARDERVSVGTGGHKQLQSKIFRYDKPEAVIDSYGNKGHPSQRVNCRCIARGIILELGEVIEKSPDGVGYQIKKRI